jgi:hypothetical protein
MPARFANIETECEKIGRFGKIKFAAKDLMGTAVSGSGEVYRVSYERGFCEFGLTGTAKLQILTMIFKSLISDWQMILDTQASRNVLNVIELKALAQC